MFPAMRDRLPAHTLTRACVAQQRVGAADSLDAAWASFRRALARAVDAVNTAPAAVRAGAAFRVAVGPSDDGVEVVVLHNHGGRSAAGDDGFLPDALLPRAAAASATCLIL